MKIWSVIYWDDGEEPVVSLFNNEESANQCYKYFKTCHKGCCIDECDVFSEFFVT